MYIGDGKINSAQTNMSFHMNFCIISYISTPIKTFGELIMLCFCLFIDSVFHHQPEKTRSVASAQRKTADSLRRAHKTERNIVLRERADESWFLF